MGAGGKKPVIPADTRWDSLDETFDSFISNSPFYLRVIMEHPEEVEESITNIVKNTGVMSAALDFKKHTSLIMQAIDVVSVNY